MASERAFKIAKNVVGENRIRLLPENMEMNLFLKYNLRAINQDIDDLESPPESFRPPNCLIRDTRDSDNDSDDEDNLTDSQSDEDSSIEFSDSDDESDDDD